MRGATALIIAIVLVIIGIAIVAAIYGIFNIYSVKEPTQSPQNRYMDNFNYTTYLLDKNPIDLSSYNECKNLMKAIENAIVNKNPSKVDDIAYGTANEFDSAANILFPFIGDCPAYDLKEILTTLAPGLEQKVCTFRLISVNEINQIISGVDDYGGASDAAKLYYDNCLYNPSSSIPLVISGNVGPLEDINHLPTTTNLYYSPDYLYIRNGDYLHYSTASNLLNDIGAFSNAYNGPGRLKIYVGDAKFDSNGECIFNIYFCPRTAIAKFQENRSVDVFNIFRYLEIFDMLVTPYYIRDVTDLTEIMGDYSRKAFSWNYYEVALDKEYKVETIINAIKEGLYQNVYAKNYSWGHPHWDIEKDAFLEKSNECWNPDYNDRIKDNRELNRTRSIRFNCGNDNICNGSLIIRIAVRRDFKDVNSNGKADNNYENYISTIISFCDDTTSGGPAPLLCSEYDNSNDCTDADCTWCPRCSGFKVNHWKEDRCIDRGLSCGYECIVDECEADCVDSLDCTTKNIGTMCVRCKCEVMLR